MNKESSVFRAATLIALITIISKIIGFLRDVVIANFYGASMVSDAYFYAYQIPAIGILILGGVGGPFHSATVAVFSKIIPSFDKKPPLIAQNLFKTFLTISLLLSAIVAICVFIFSDVIMSLIITGGSSELVALSSLHLKIMSPILIFGGIIGIYYGLLVSYNKFLMPNLSPILMSLIIICALFFCANEKTGLVLAIATSIGALCQLLIQIPSVHKLGFSYRPKFNFLNNPELKQIGELLFPAVLSSAIGQIHIYIDMFFSSQLQTGIWTAIGYANRVFQFPLGVLITAFLVPLFPLFSKLVAQNNFEEVKNYFHKGIGMLNFIGIPMLFLIALCGYDGIKLLFERGAFDSDATLMVSEALFYLSLGLIPYVFRDFITRVFYAFNDSKTPFVIALISIGVKVILNYVFINLLGFGIGGITFSTACVTLFNAIILGILIRKKLKLDYRKFFAGLINMLICAGICFVLMQPFVNLSLTENIFVLALKIALICLLYGVLYFAVSLLFRQEFALLLLTKFLKR